MSKTWRESKEVNDALKRFQDFNPKSIEPLMDEYGIQHQRVVDENGMVKFFASQFLFVPTLANLNKIGTVEDIKKFYKMNSNGFRSDEFRIDHGDKKHAVFAGCSVTSGEGMPEQFLWSKKVYEKINSDEEYSGYFNIAAPGFTSMEIISQIFSYIKKYGNPNDIFIAFPDIEREYVNLTKFSFFNSSNDYDPMKQIDRDRVDFLLVGMMKALEVYCKSNKINLHAFIWSNFAWGAKLSDHRPDPRMDFDWVSTFDHKRDTAEHVNNFINNYNKNDKYYNFLEKALDDQHFGIAFQDFYYNFAYDMYQNSKKML